ncbi:MAG: sensor histidine kinase [Acidimicrobiia bacterium]
MSEPPQDAPALLPVNRTLTRVVLLMRLLGWIWLLILAVVALSTTRRDINTGVMVGAMVVATAGTAVTFLAAQRGFLGEGWYTVFDGALALLLGAAGWLADFGEFIVGGYPASWLFIVAYATNYRVTGIAGLGASAVFAVLHVIMDLEETRVFGSIQFVVVALVVGWAFDALRKQEELRIEAEQERAEAEHELAAEQERSGRLAERSVIARELHDSVLQTLKLISASANDAPEVRYLARVQERDLRRTINEYQSPYEDSFRARLLDARASIEDRYRVEIEQVVKDDAEMDDGLRAVVAAATEAMNNAARHSGAKTIDLFAEIRDGKVQVNVRDRGTGFDLDRAGGGIALSINERLSAVGGVANIKTAPGRGTEVQLVLPLR